MNRPRPRKRTGFTLVELVIAAGIVSLLVGLLLVAALRVREAGFRTQCQNNLKQIGLALHTYHLTHGLFPGNGGWDGAQEIPSVNGPLTKVTVYDFASGVMFTWGIGDPQRAPFDQTGSWAYSILPFLDAESQFHSRAWTVPLGIYACPSRRPPEALPATDDEYGNYNGGGWVWGKTDYAANAQTVPDRPHCLRLGDFSDGSSTTILCGEKAMNLKNARTGTWYWDEPFFTGGSGGTQRSNAVLLPDATDTWTDFRYNWGASHSVVNFLFADASVRPLPYETDPLVVAALLSPNGGEPVDAP
jgi:type II secretory pathway pseudopilin PulG